MADHNIAVTRLSHPVRRLTPVLWRKLLAKFEQQG